MGTDEEYLLGVNRQELDRLQFQHTVWGGITRAFLQRLGVSQGWDCLDAGAGPGLVAADLRRLVGDRGEITALEPSQFYLDVFSEEVRRQSWKNVRLLKGSVEEAPLPEAAYDLVFFRWVIAFVADPERFLEKLLRALKPGGILAMEDYYYEGLSLFPRGGAFDTMADIVRAYYASVGGDPYITGKIPAHLRRRGLTLIDFTPNQLAGGPKSAITEWAHRFFVPHIPVMVEKGLASPALGQELLADWLGHRENPDAIFFSPIVVDVAGKSPSTTGQPPRR